MLSSGLRKVMKALLILLGSCLGRLDHDRRNRNATSEVSTARLDPKRVIERKRIGYWANGQRISVKKTSLRRSTR